MSLGGNLSSGYTDNLLESTRQCNIPVTPRSATAGNCCIQSDISGSQPVAIYESAYLKSKLKKILPPTPSTFALYPKATIPSSVRTQNIVSQTLTPIYLQNQTLQSQGVAVTIDPSQRFSQYSRFQAPSPCLPVPTAAQLSTLATQAKSNTEAGVTALANLIALAGMAPQAGVSQPSNRACN